MDYQADSQVEGEQSAETARALDDGRPWLTSEGDDMMREVYDELLMRGDAAAAAAAAAAAFGGSAAAAAFGGTVDTSLFAEQDLYYDPMTDVAPAMFGALAPAQPHYAPGPQQAEFPQHFHPLPAQGSLGPALSSFHELSPLTTVESHTPLVSLVHLQQLSFFSAQQHPTRNSIDQSYPPFATSYHRGSLDMYSKSRLSIDSQHSSINANSAAPGRYAGFLLTNYIPFMGDRAQPPMANGVPDTPSFAEQAPPAPASRHLIRSIFKNRNPELFGELEPSQIDAAMEELAGEDAEGGADGADFEDSAKKRKSKRSLFTRFKSLTEEQAASELKAEYMGDDLDVFVEPLDTHSLVSVQLSSQGGVVLDSSSLNTSHVPNSSEPDYAALFQNVGKRKNIVTTSLFIKNKPRKATDAAPAALTHDSDISLGPSLNDHEFRVKQEADDAPVEGGDAPGPTVSSTLASASKRILGLKKKGTRAVVEDRLSGELDASSSDAAESVAPTVVKVDLAALDLPPDTQIFPTSVVSKARTRGRKENKEADMLDVSKIFLCSYCSRRFKRQEHLTRHFRSLHTFEKPYDCLICHKKFSRLDNLNQHLKIHRQEDMAAQGLTLDGQPLAAADERDERAALY